jgi:uncharacterized membrane protein YdjX (TVP38/TMEM64 family)
MRNIISRRKQAEVGKGEWLKKRVIPLLTLFLVIAIMVAIFFYRDKVAELGNYGYLGAFLVSLVSNASIFLPVPGLLLLVALGATFNPVLVGLAGAAGGSIGEMTGYVLGYGGRGITPSNKMYARAEGWMRRWGVMAVFIFSLVPLLPFDVAGMVAGVLRFPVWKFLLACWFGKAILYTGMAFAGAWGWDAFASGLLMTSPIAIAILAALTTLALLALALVIEGRTWKRGQ